MQEMTIGNAGSMSATQLSYFDAYSHFISAFICVMLLWGYRKVRGLKHAPKCHFFFEVCSVYCCSCRAFRLKVDAFTL